MTKEAIIKKDHLSRSRLVKFKKYVVSVSKDDSATIETITSKLNEANKKTFGDEITFTQLAIFAISKLSDKDIQSLKMESLSDDLLIDMSIEQLNKNSDKKVSKQSLLKEALKINKFKLVQELEQHQSL